MRKSKRIALFMLSLVFAVSAGIFALGTAFAAPAYKDTAVTRHPFGEAAGMYMDLTTYGEMKTDGTYPIGGTFPTDIGATVNYNADAKALHILFTAPKSVGDKVQIPQGSTLTDPDGNGVNDTYGFCPGKGEHCWNPFYNAFGVTTDWDIMEDGSLDYMYTQKEFKDFLTWANGLFNEGCIYPTFSSIQANGDRDLFYNGKIGMLITNAESHVYYIKSKMTAMGNGDKFGFAEPPVGTAALGKEGAGGFADWGGWWGGYCITKNCKNIEAALKLLDYMLSPEGAKLRTYGMEGVHYTEENGAITPVVEERAKEGGGKWEEFTVDGVSAPIGRYVMGTLFGYPVDWEEFEKSGKIEYLISAELLDPENEALVQQAFDAMRLNTSRLTNVTAYSKTAVSVMNSVQEESKAFVNNAIIGKKNLTSDWDDMIGRLKGLKWSAMENSVMETLKTLGIVE